MAVSGYLSLPHDAVGWCAVYGCGITWSYSLTISHGETNNLKSSSSK